MDVSVLSKCLEAGEKSESVMTSWGLCHIGRMLEMHVGVSTDYKFIPWIVMCVWEATENDAQDKGASQNVDRLFFQTTLGVLESKYLKVLPELKSSSWKMGTKEVYKNHKHHHHHPHPRQLVIFLHKPRV